VDDSYFLKKSLGKSLGERTRRVRKEIVLSKLFRKEKGFDAQEEEAGVGNAKVVGRPDGESREGVCINVGLEARGGKSRVARIGIGKIAPYSVRGGLNWGVTKKSEEGVAQKGLTKKNLQKNTSETKGG